MKLRPRDFCVYKAVCRVTAVKIIALYPPFVHVTHNKGTSWYLQRTYLFNTLCVITRKVPGLCLWHITLNLSIGIPVCQTNSCLKQIKLGCLILLRCEFWKERNGIVFKSRVVQEETQYKIYSVISHKN